MKMRLICPCGKHLQVDGRNAGKRGRCPQCHEEFVIPFANKEHAEEVAFLANLDDRADRAQAVVPPRPASPRPAEARKSATPTVPASAATFQAALDDARPSVRRGYRVESEPADLSKVFAAVAVVGLIAIVAAGAFLALPTLLKDWDGGGSWANLWGGGEPQAVPPATPAVDQRQLEAEAAIIAYNAAMADEAQVQDAERERMQQESLQTYDENYVGTPDEIPPGALAQSPYGGNYEESQQQETIPPNIPEYGPNYGYESSLIPPPANSTYGSYSGSISPRNPSRGGYPEAGTIIVDE